MPDGVKVEMMKLEVLKAQFKAEASGWQEKNNFELRGLS